MSSLQDRIKERSALLESLHSASSLEKAHHRLSQLFGPVDSFTEHTVRNQQHFILDGVAFWEKPSSFSVDPDDELYETYLLCSTQEINVAGATCLYLWHVPVQSLDDLALLRRRTHLKDAVLDATVNLALLQDMWPSVVDPDSLRFRTQSL